MEELEAAYLATTYRVYTRTGYIDVYISQSNPSLQDYCVREGVAQWAIITASNPNSRALSRSENEARNRQLEQELNRGSLRYLRADGIPCDDSWEAEASFFVCNIAPDEAMALGKRFSQNALVAGDNRGHIALVWLVDK